VLLVQNVTAMQKRIDPSSRGFFTIFKKDALQFVMRWHEQSTVHESWVTQIGIYAASPEVLRMHWRVNFVNDYLAWPDLAAALLNFLRQKFSKLETSKAGKLKKFISQNNCVKWERGFGAKPDSLGYCSIWDLQDGEIGSAFQHSPGGCEVEIGDVTKARRWVKENQDAGKKFAAKVLDKDGYLQIKVKSRRRK